MCERCAKDDVKVGDVVWRAVIDDIGDTWRVDVSSAVITKAPNKARRVQIREAPADKKSSWAFFGLGVMHPLDALQHSRQAALDALFAIEDAAYNDAVRRLRLVHDALHAKGPKRCK